MVTLLSVPETPAVPVVMAPQPPRWLDVLRQTARERGHCESTISSFADWSLRYIRFHGTRPPRELQIPDIGRFEDCYAPWIKW